jgi:hypothetical protein
VEGPDLAGEDEGVAELEDVDVALLDLADLPPGPAAHQQAHVQGRGPDDGADVQPVPQRGHGVSHPPSPVRSLHDPAEAVVGLQRIAAGGDEAQHLVEVLPCQGGVGLGRADLLIELVLEERVAAGHAHHVLG